MFGKPSVVLAILLRTGRILGEIPGAQAQTAVGPVIAVARRRSRWLGCRRLIPLGLSALMATPTLAQSSIEDRYELDPATVEGSPTLQRWSDGTPDILSDIRHDPSFRTRIQAGYAVFPSSDGSSGFTVGIEDWFVGNTALTVSGDYQRNSRGERESYGADLRYYVLPLGGYINVAPVLGYRNIRTDNFQIDGLNLGFQVKVIPSRGGGADFAYTQTWVAPGNGDTASTTEFEFGYALTDQLRVSTEVEWQFTPGETDSQVGIGLEWML